MSWAYSAGAGSAGDLHAASASRVATAGVGRAVVAVSATAPAVVLGSAEPAGHLDPEAVAAAGLEVARRRSGGGAVLVGPGRCLWVDLVIPRDDPLWSDDVGRATWWVGECWATALGAVGVGGGVVHRGAMVRSPWSERACFAGLGPGEVTVGGRKVVGIAQRRTRFGALFQCAVALGPPHPLAGARHPEAHLARVDPAEGAEGAGPNALRQLAEVQALAAPERQAMADDLLAGTLALPADEAPALVGALREVLPPA